MCTGRVDPAFIFRAFAKGTDGVFVGGCWLGECHYVTEGNYSALALMHLSKRILEHLGVDPGRLRLEWISSSEGGRFAEVVEDFSRQLKELGPLGETEGRGGEELAADLERVIRLIPYIKIVMREKLASRFEKEEEYENLFTREEVERLFSDVVSYYIDPEKCRACMICMRKCPVGAIEGARKRIHVIDQDQCIKCGTCIEVCPPRFSAVKKIVKEPVPPPLPEEARALAAGGE